MEKMNIYKLATVWLTRVALIRVTWQDRPMNNAPSSTNAQYPCLTLDLGLIEANVRSVTQLCTAQGISVAGVVKGAGGFVPVAAAMVRGGVSSLASSRLPQLRALRAAMRPQADHVGASGIPSSLPLGLLRIPGPGEIDEAVALADWSLQSDPTALGLMAEAAGKSGRHHGVVLMLDLGDLREGWFDEDELFEQALRVERDLTALHLRGIGTNLGCYGSILPAADNLGRLVALARRIEAAIGRSLDVVSGGATTSLPLLLRGGMPAGITELRIGEAVLCAGDLPRFHGVSVPGVRMDAFTLRARIIELRKKPSLPVGERFIDAFGERPVYEDRGTRMHLLLGVGKRDFGSHGYLVPRDNRIHVIGSSSDHLICEADEPCDDLRYGTVLEFDIMYGAMLFLCDGNPYINVEFSSDLP